MWSCEAQICRHAGALWAVGAALEAQGSWDPEKAELRSGSLQPENSASRTPASVAVGLLGPHTAFLAL